MRCKICDYAPGVPESSYHASLALPKNRELYEDKDTGEITCNCFRSDVYYGVEEILGDSGDLDTLDLEPWEIENGI